jgi:hypothetical protein
MRKKADSGSRPYVQVQIRMSEAQLTRVREYQKKLEEKTGAEIAFSAMMRSLIEKGLEVG